MTAEPHRLVADHDATGGQQLVLHTQAQWEPEIDLGREPIPRAGGAYGGRQTSPLRGSAERRKPARPVMKPLPSKGRPRFH